ncbi:ribosome recycling factor [bacterium]|nr:ribosome recycling factor [bacterium]
MSAIQPKSKLEKTMEFLREELATVRTGRANPGMVEDISLDAYGSPMTIKELGSIVIQDPQNIIVAPWDKGLVSAISKAIRESELQLNPVEENDRLRVPVPPLTEERRTEFAKIVATKN